VSSSTGSSGTRSRARRSARRGKAVFHLFVFGVYFTPLLGRPSSPTASWESTDHPLHLAALLRGPRLPRDLPRRPDRFLRRAHPDRPWARAASKPCVVRPGGDQFTEQNKHLVNKVSQCSTGAINLGSFLRLAPDPKTCACGPIGGIRIPGILNGARAPSSSGWGRNLLRQGPAHGKEPAFLLGRAAQRPGANRAAAFASSTAPGPSTRRGRSKA